MVIDLSRFVDGSSLLGRRVSSYSVGTLERECKWLLENNDIECDQNEKSHLDIISDILDVVVVWIVLRPGCLDCSQWVAIVWLYINLVSSYSDPCSVRWLQQVHSRNRVHTYKGCIDHSHWGIVLCDLRGWVLKIVAIAMWLMEKNFYEIHDQGLS